MSQEMDQCARDLRLAAAILARVAKRLEAGDGAPPPPGQGRPGRILELVRSLVAKGRAATLREITKRAHWPREIVQAEVDRLRAARAVALVPHRGRRGPSTLRLEVTQ